MFVSTTLADASPAWRASARALGTPLVLQAVHAFLKPVEMVPVAHEFHSTFSFSFSLSMASMNA